MPYVIFTPGVDYNDETHSIGGEYAAVIKNGYIHLADARAAVREKLRADLKHYMLGDFSEDGSGYNNALNLMAEWRNIPVESVNYKWGTYHRYPHELMYNITWLEFIEEAEKRDVEWITLVPELYQIVEVNFDDNNN